MFCKELKKNQAKLVKTWKLSLHKKWKKTENFIFCAVFDICFRLNFDQ